MNISKRVNYTAETKHWSCYYEKSESGAVSFINLSFHVPNQVDHNTFGEASKELLEIKKEVYK